MARTPPPRALMPLLLSSLLAGCGASLPAQGRYVPPVSEAEELRLAAEADAGIRREMGLLNDAALQRVVSQAGARLAAASGRPDLPWHFTVLDVAAANAFALPGGYVYLTRGLLPYLNDEAELAAVIGHEMGHVASGHAARLLAPGGGTVPPVDTPGILCPVVQHFRSRAAALPDLRALFARFGPEDELQACLFTVTCLARAGWDPRGVESSRSTLERLDVSTDGRGVPTWVETHGSSADFADDIRTAIDQAVATVSVRQRQRDGDDYVERLHDLVFGDDLRDGLVRGNEFLQPALGVAFMVPAGWEVTNDRTRMVAVQPGQTAFLLLDPVPAARRRQVAEVAGIVMQRAGFQLVSGGATTIGGLDSFVGTYQGTVDGLGDALVRAAWFRRSGRVFQLTGLAASGRFEAVRTLFESSIRSFRSLEAGEAGRFTPQRLDTYTVRSGDTWESIARRNGGVVMPIALALINHAELTDPPQPGTAIKVVVAR
jgi:predicted Zn-dependent protease